MKNYPIKINYINKLKVDFDTDGKLTSRLQVEAWESMKNNWPTIVVVDGSPAIKKLFEGSIRDLAVNLLVFETAGDSWEYLKDARPNLLFLNIILPDKNGFTLLRELRKLPIHENTSVIMVTSKDYAQDRYLADDLGVKEYIPKPMPMQTITDIVVKYTEAKSKSE